MAQYRIEDFLSQQLIDTDVLNWIDSKEYTTGEMSKMWYDQLQSGLLTEERYYSPEQMAELFSSIVEDKVVGRLEKMFTPETFAYLNNADSMSAVPSNPATAQQALHYALADNSVAAGWEPHHRIQFYHSRYDMVVPYSNYIAFSNAHPGFENSIYRINDTYSSSDHMTAATIFFLELIGTNSFAPVFQWISENPTPTGIDANNFADNQHLMSDGDNWYTLDGRRLSNRPTTNGIYIHNQRKIVIR